jgi:hypothetical protein
MADNFDKVTEIVIVELEGGYFHPDMMADGRLKYNSLMASSGETYYGLDRKNGVSLASNPAWGKFWAIIDNSGARKNWKWNHIDRPLESQLKPLAIQIMKPRYELYSAKYLSPQTKEKVSKNEKLTFHFSYAVWNGEGWFKKFASDMNKAVLEGKTDKQLEQVAIDSRTKEGLKSGSLPNTLIKQTGEKIEDIFGSGILDELKKNDG